MSDTVGESSEEISAEALTEVAECPREISEKDPETPWESIGPVPARQTFTMRPAGREVGKETNGGKISTSAVPGTDQPPLRIIVDVLLF